MTYEELKATIRPAYRPFRKYETRYIRNVFPERMYYKNKELHHPRLSRWPDYDTFEGTALHATRYLKHNGELYCVTVVVKGDRARAMLARAGRQKSSYISPMVAGRQDERFFAAPGSYWTQSVELHAAVIAESDWVPKWAVSQVMHALVMDLPRHETWMKVMEAL